MKGKEKKNQSEHTKVFLSSSWWKILEKLVKMRMKKFCERKLFKVNFLIQLLPLPLFLLSHLTINFDKSLNIKAEGGEDEKQHSWARVEKRWESKFEDVFRACEINDVWISQLIASAWLPAAYQAVKVNWNFNFLLIVCLKIVSMRKKEERKNVTRRNKNDELWYHEHTSQCFYCDKRFILQLWTSFERHQNSDRDGERGSQQEYQKFIKKNLLKSFKRSFQSSRRAFDLKILNL